MLQGVRIIKMQAWEEYFLLALGRLRGMVSSSTQFFYLKC
jgi:hypothetical protein